MLCDAVRYGIDKDVMSMYLDTAKTFMNLSSGALGLTIVFREKIAGVSPGSHVSRPLLASWMLFLVAIGSSAFYQFLAVKFLDSVSCSPAPIQHLEYLVRHPGKVYGLMLVTFFAGACVLVLATWRELPQDSAERLRKLH